MSETANVDVGASGLEFSHSYLSLITFTNSPHAYRDLVADGEDLIGTLLSKLTAALTGISTDAISFSGGPLGDIEGIFDKFGLDFDGLATEFINKYNAFTTDLLNFTPEQQLIFNLRPVSLPQFSNILQIGSKIPSIQYSVELKNILWDKLDAAFPSLTYNGVKIPNIPSGQTFAATFPSRDFPGKDHAINSFFIHTLLDSSSSPFWYLLFAVELFLPHIAVAFGFAPSFFDPKAQSFSLDVLYKQNFGPDLSLKMLNSLKAKPELNGMFDRFTGMTLSGLPLDPVTFEVFDIDHFLPEIQFALDLCPAVDFAAPNFRASHIFDALFPKSVPTVKSFGSFIKKNIMSKLRTALDGLFDVNVDVPAVGLSVTEITFGGPDGVNLGEYTESNNKLFPPLIDIDAVQVSVCSLGPNHVVYHVCLIISHYLCAGICL